MKHPTTIRGTRWTSLLMAILLTGTTACQKEEPKGPTPGELAEKAGTEYFSQLVKGNTDAYVHGLDGTQTATAGYRQALADNARQFVHRQDSLHQGIKAVEADSTSFSDKDSTARVFLRLTYGDGSKERILLPMLCRKGRWYMR